MTGKRGVKSRWNATATGYVRQMIGNGLSDEEIARAMGVHRTTIMRLRHQLESESADKAREPEPGTLVHYIWIFRRLCRLYDEIEHAYHIGDAEDISRIDAQIALLRNTTLCREH